MQHCRVNLLLQFNNQWFSAVRCCSSAKSESDLARSNTVNARGMALIRDPHLNKGMAFTLHERQMLNIHGLLPPAFMSQETQIRRVMKNLRAATSDLSRYVQLSALQDRNEKLFYSIITHNIEELMPVVYTPTVGLACQNFGLVFRKPKGLFITIHDNSVERIYNILCNWPETNIKAIVVSDGERILGLGDLGASGMGIPIGKMALYIALARIQPSWCLPILLDVGTNNKNLINDPFYIGLKQKRVRGVEYDYFLDNFMKAVTKRFGIETLVQFEDFANHNAFRLLNRYRDNYCVFNDDIQGTASVVLSGLMGACKITETKLTDQKLLFLGAGEANMGIAMLTCAAMEKAGMTFEQARERIYLIDIEGLLVNSRTDIDDHQREFAKPMEHMKKLIDIVKLVRPTILIGASSCPGAFNEEVIGEMAKINKRPIIFALSNPTSRAECTAQQAYEFSEGRAVFASGSPFPPVTFGGQTFVPGQGNNAYVFPGVALAVVLFQIRHVTDDHFLVASEVLASLLTDEQIKQGRVYPPLTEINEISVKIAIEIANYAYKTGMASMYPEPNDKEDYIRSMLYNFEYNTYKPDVYDWPENVMKVI